ncbi:RNA-binding protein [Candidatus Woesearchaeota archaeon]|nr:MAG: RNA-binding protein [Candidatus Woesearchaeota archaeon]
MRKRLSNSEIKALSIELHFPFHKKDKIEIIETVIFVNDKPAFFYFEDHNQKKTIPTLHFLLDHPDYLKTLIIDMPAIPFLIKGADVMRPGIVQIDETIVQGEPVVLKDQNFKKPICIGLALCSGKDMQQMAKGKAVQNIHYVGDAIWKSTHS